MQISLIIIGALLAGLAPIYQIRKVFYSEEREYLNFLKKSQKRAYLLSLVGVLFLSYILSFSLLTLLMNGIYLMLADPGEALRSIALMTIPFIIIAGLGLISFYVPFKYTEPERFVYNHQLANLILLMMGIVSFFIVAALGYFLFLGLEQLGGFSQGQGGFIQVLESKGFHPVKALFYSLFLSPAAIALGGFISLMTRRRKSY